MAQTFPFTRGNPTDFSDGQKLPAAVINTIDKNAAQAADGLLWSDVAIAKNFVTKSAPTVTGVDSFWDSYSSRWFAIGQSGGAPKAYYSADGRDDWQPATVPVGTSTWTAAACGASNGAGAIVIGAVTASGTQKIRYSADGGTTWAVATTTTTGANGVTCLVWFPAAALFIAGMSTTVTGNIETSPDGLTWTQRTAPNTNARVASACSATVAVVLTSVSTNKCIRSTDGVTWTEGTMPSTAVWQSITWDPLASLFIALAASGAIATSTDGITWTSSGALAAPFTASTITGICTWRRIWFALGTIGSASAVRISVNGGAAWTTVKHITLLAAGASISTGDDQVLLSADTVAYATLRGGL